MPKFARTMTDQQLQDQIASLSKWEKYLVDAYYQTTKTIVLDEEQIYDLQDSIKDLPQDRAELVTRIANELYTKDLIARPQDYYNGSPYGSPHGYPSQH